MECSMSPFGISDMKFYRDLYVGESVRESERIKEKLAGKGLDWKFWRQVHLIAVSETSDQLEIFESKMLLQPFWNQEELRVVGIAGNRDEAIRLVISLTEKVVRETGGADCKGYLLSEDSFWEEVS